MAAILISGTNGEALVGVTTDVRHILETSTGGTPDFDGDGRVFEPLHLECFNSHATSQAELVLYDDDESSGPTNSSNVRIGGVYPIPPNSLLEKTWERGRGPKFRTNIIASTRASRGTIAAGDVYASGLLH